VAQVAGKSVGQRLIVAIFEDSSTEIMARRAGL
jgi:hypothetical protein